MQHNEPIDYRIRQSLNRYVPLLLISMGLFVLLRVYEFIFISGPAGYPPGSALDLLSGVTYDLLLSLRLSLLLLIPFVLADIFNRKTARIIFASVTTIILITEVSLLRYFATTRIPLESDILGYSMKEINQTIGASGELSLLNMLPLLFFLLLSIFAFYKWHTFSIPSLARSFIFFLLIIALLPLLHFNPDPAEHKDVFRMNITANKFNLFSESLIDHFFPDKSVPKYNPGTVAATQAELMKETVPQPVADQKPETAAKSAESRPKNAPTAGNAEKTEPVKSITEPGNPFNYISSDYPFLHEEHTPDLLAPYFNTGTRAPSIVFIVVESLGSAYSGADAYLGSFTPFLDSLTGKSLYWKNCLSTSGRTFSVMPSLLASLPFGEKGFANLGSKMPDHLSLPALLNRNAGYKTSFYYGGDPKFDDMEQFLLKQGATRIVGEKNFGAGYKKLPSSNSGFTWGYGDREIFRRYLDDLKSGETEKRVDVILTIAMHSPFLVQDQDHYNELFEKRLNELNLKEEDKKYNRQYQAQFATIMFFDDALRYFFSEFSKLQSYENTIFVITGDHRMPEIPISTQIDRFHVPLVIYSPLLKKNQTFSSIVTHYDVAPSLLSLLKNRYALSLPTVTSWIGHGLDTNVAFRNLNSYPLKRNTGELIDFISEDFFLSGTTLYKIYPSMDIEPVNNPTMQQRLQEQFDKYKAANNYIIGGNHLIPDSLNKYVRP